MIEDLKNLAMISNEKLRKMSDLFIYSFILKMLTSY